MENCDGTVDRRGVRWNYGVKKSTIGMKILQSNYFLQQFNQFLPNTLHYLLKKKKNRIVEEEKGRCFYSIQLQSYYGMIEVQEE